MPRSDQHIRQWKILKLLEVNGRATLRRIASEVEEDWHERTLRRDLDVLSLSGFPIHVEREDGKTFWVLGETYRRFPVPLTPTEILSLHCGYEFLKPLENTFLGNALKSLMQKTSAVLNREARTYLNLLRKNISVRSDPHNLYGDKSALIEQMKTALEHGQTIEMKYVPLRTTRATTRRVNPYILRFQGGALYMIGYDHLRKEERTFLVDRIRSFQLTDEKFQPPLFFSAEDYFKDAFGIFRGKPEAVELVFQDWAARWVKERVWHPSQIAIPLKDGKLRFRLNVGVTPEFQNWVMGFGSQVKVVKPERLSRSVQDEAWKLLGKYQGINPRRRPKKARTGSGRKKAGRL